MPTYRYECDRCEAIHEEFQSISEDRKTKCPDCGGKLTRMIGTGGGVILKGSGFYTTDYRSDSYHSAAKKDSEAGSGKKAEGKSEGKTGSKPAGDGGAKADKPAAKSDGKSGAKGKKKD